MSGREWKQGDVALVTLRGGSVGICLRGWGGGWTTSDCRTYPDSSVSEARPLVVIDPEDREQVERLVDAFRSVSGWASGIKRESATAMQAALREFANPTPPRPDEPQGLGAVVEAHYADDDGKGFGPAVWASRGDGSWVCLTDGYSAHVVGWPFLQNVTVLREGVTP